MKSLLKKLNAVQVDLKAPKGQYNSFGKYNYRSCEDILEGLKPHLEARFLALNITDKVELVGDRFYIVATATLYDLETGESISSQGWAREAETKKGMDPSQITGSASSYARKYALNGLLAIDDTKDADTMDNRQQGGGKPRGNNHNNLNNSNNQGQKISTAQIKRMFSMASGKDELVRAVMSRHGYESSKDILKKDYDMICKGIEDGLRMFNKGGGR